MECVDFLLHDNSRLGNVYNCFIVYPFSTIDKNNHWALLTSARLYAGNGKYFLLKNWRILSVVIKALSALSVELTNSTENIICHSSAPHPTILTSPKFSICNPRIVKLGRSVQYLYIWHSLLPVLHGHHDDVHQTSTPHVYSTCAKCCYTHCTQFTILLSKYLLRLLTPLSNRVTQASKYCIYHQSPVSPSKI